MKSDETKKCCSSREGLLPRKTASVCPVCLRKIPAVLERNGKEGIYLKKSCPAHGTFRTVVWKDKVDFASWIRNEKPVDEQKQGACTLDCASCASHAQESCCVILEVTKECNLHCNFCFARGGEKADMPSFSELTKAIDRIVSLAGGVLIQFSGGEPTLRDDLPALAAYAKKAGCSYTQINTNGIRLAQDSSYVKQLSDAGLDIVFLQFDGTNEHICRELRGRDLLEIKRRAIENCGRHRIGVTLVPTVVRGINDKEAGNIIRFALEQYPAVRSVHFQPVTCLGRYPAEAQREDRYTLDELMADLCGQTGIPEKALLPSRCDHALCEFHSTFLVNEKRQLIPVSDRGHDTRCCCTSAEKNRAYVARHWSRGRTEVPESFFTRPAPDEGLVLREKDAFDLDTLIGQLRTNTMKISAMAFQDAMNLNLERLYRCSLHVYDGGKLIPFCRKYLTPWNCSDRHK